MFMVVIALACVVAIVNANHLALAQPHTNPEIVGAFGHLVQAFTHRGIKVIANVDRLQHALGQRVFERFRLGGGILGNLQDYVNFVSQEHVIFWSAITNDILDLSWEFRKILVEAIKNLEREFHLVTGHPIVRDWLRELRDLSRTSVNESLRSIAIHHNQWWGLVQEYERELIALVNRGRCQDHERVQQTVERRIKIAFAESWDIINHLKQANYEILVKYINRGYELTNKVYQAEIQALRYFVT